MMQPYLPLPLALPALTFLVANLLMSAGNGRRDGPDVEADEDVGGDEHEQQPLPDHPLDAFLENYQD